MLRQTPAAPPWRLNQGDVSWRWARVSSTGRDARGRTGSGQRNAISLSTSPTMGVARIPYQYHSPLPLLCPPHAGPIPLASSLVLPLLHHHARHHHLSDPGAHGTPARTCLAGRTAARHSPARYPSYWRRDLAKLRCQHHARALPCNNTAGHRGPCTVFSTSRFLGWMACRPRLWFLCLPLHTHYSSRPTSLHACRCRTRQLAPRGAHYGTPTSCTLPSLCNSKRALPTLPHTTHAFPCRTPLQACAGLLRLACFCPHPRERARACSRTWRVIFASSFSIRAVFSFIAPAYVAVAARASGLLSRNARC